nr:odorant receptor 7 [Graphosoma rubrolineatum]
MWLFESTEEAEERVQVETFIDQQYYRLMQVSSLYLKMGPRDRLVSLIQLSIYVTILASHWLLFVNATFAIYDINMVLFSQSVHFSLLIQLSLLLPICFRIKHQKMYQFHKMLSYNFFDYHDPPIIGEESLRSAMADENRRMFLIPVGVAAATGSVLIIAPIVDHNAGVFDFNRTANIFSDNLPYRYLIYSFPIKDGFGHYFALIWQMLCGILITLIIGGGGFLFLNVAQNVCLQLKILISSLDHIEERTEHLVIKLFGNKYKSKNSSYRDKNYASCYSICLRKNFEHHQIIVSAFRILEELASVPVFLAYMTGTIVIALSLISAGSAKELPGTTVASMILCGVEVGYMFLFSVFGQRLSDLSCELRFKIYNIKWYLCDKGLKANMKLFQEMTLKPLTMTVGGIVPANMETFSTVMNSAYSYYNLVNAFDG